MPRILFFLACLVVLCKAQGQVSFNLPANPSPASIVAAEYFFDTDPGFGNGTSISISAANDITASFTANISSLSKGVHRLYVRMEDANGNWSLTNVQTFGIFQSVTIPANAAASNIISGEYFIDNDPGFGNGTALSISSSTDITANAVVNISSLSTGVHRIYFRMNDAAGSWSHTNMQTFYIFNSATIPGNPSATNIVYGEYFMDNDPGFGNGTSFSFTQGTDITASNIMVRLSGLSQGVHRIYVRTKDANGNWSLTNLQTISIAVANISLPPNPTPSNIISLEYFFDNDPGFGNGHAVTVPASTDISNFSFAVDLTGLSNGTHHLYVRMLDDWSLTNVVSFMYGSPLPVTWLSFSAKAISDSVVLKWQTANEQNNKQYEVERSEDGVQFSTIGTVAGAVNSNTVHNYHFTDLHPVKGVNYYRIKQTDVNGTFSYSATVSVRLSNDQFLLLTNPVHNTLYVQLPDLPTQNSSLKIFDQEGKLVQSNSLQTGASMQKMNVSSLVNGTYILMYQNGSTKKTVKFIKL